MTKKSTVEGIFCDIEKAFSCINHDILCFYTKFLGLMVDHMLSWRNTDLLINKLSTAF
jgi:hypothetical protein